MTALKEFDVQTDVKPQPLVGDMRRVANPTFSRERGTFCFKGDVPMVSTHDPDEKKHLELEIALSEIKPETFPALLRRLQAESWINEEMIEDFQLRLRELGLEAGFELTTSPQWPWEKIGRN
jgi:hypothetical protein